MATQNTQATQALYIGHFGLREAPFKITPTTEFFYSGGQRGDILHALLYGISVGEGIMAVTGEVGSGKTMLLRTLLDRLPDNVDIIYIANPSLSGQEILFNICEELGLQASENRNETVKMLHEYLLRQHAAKRRVIAFIDEAQAMPDDSLEEIRLLSNMETSRDKLLQMVMFGQPELDDKLRRQNMRQLRERITVYLKLKPFGRDDIREYIATRLRAAGYDGKPMFSNDACRLISKISQGLSRRINVLSDKALLSAYERSSLTVNYDDVRRAVQDVNFGKIIYRSEQSRRISRQITTIAGVAAFCLLLVIVGLRFSQFSDEQVEAVEVEAVAQAEQAQAEQTTPAQSGDSENTAAADSNAETPAAPPPASTQPAQTTQSQTQSAQTTQAQAQAATGTGAAVAAGAPTPPAAATPPPPPTPPPQPAQQNPSARQEMLAAITDLSGNGANFSSDDFARRIAENAEPHTGQPQQQGGAAEWQPVSTITPDIVNNASWSWMPASSYLRNRLNATQTLLETGGENAGAYTARLITVSQERAVFLEKFLRYFSDFYPVRNVMVYPLRLNTGDKFVITYGLYNSRDDAEVFINNIPYYFTGGAPYAQQIAVSQSESAGRWDGKR